MRGLSARYSAKIVPKKKARTLFIARTCKLDNAANGLKAGSSIFEKMSFLHAENLAAWGIKFVWRPGDWQSPGRLTWLFYWSKIVWLTAWVSKISFFSRWTGEFQIPPLSHKSCANRKAQCNIFKPYPFFLSDIFLYLSFNTHYRKLPPSCFLWNLKVALTFFLKQAAQKHRCRPVADGASSNICPRSNRQKKQNKTLWTLEN